MPPHLARTAFLGAATYSAVPAAKRPILPRVALVSMSRRGAQSCDAVVNKR